MSSYWGIYIEEKITVKDFYVGRDKKWNSNLIKKI